MIEYGTVQGNSLTSTGLAQSGQGVTIIGATLMRDFQNARCHRRVTGLAPVASFDRFDICEAYHIYSIDFAGDLQAEHFARQLSRMKFKPSPMLERYDDLSEGGQEIYDKLYRTHGNRYR